MGEVVDFNELKKKRDEAKKETEKVLNSEEQTPTPELLNKLCEVIDLQDKVSGMLLHDVTVIAKKLEMIEVSNFNSSANLQVVVTLLKEKLGVDQEAFQEIWDRDVAPELQKLQDMQKEASEAQKKEQSNIILPNNDIITPS